MIALNPAQRRALRAAAHHLNPVVTIAQKGLTEGVLAEIDRSLNAHELIKVKLQGVEREEREAALDQICRELACLAVQHIGNILVLWRKKPDAVAAPAPAKATPRPRTKKEAAAAGERRRRRTP
ncbi:MAG: ribosome assembly RNA-binding protein YhbY [Rhodocyclaceae bacterium]|nr:ribosome assembly RNA-binding protein YhbY [Rhodocyclaceae bacterium]